MYVCARVLVPFGRDKSECGCGSLEREFFHGSADAADKKIVGRTADDSAYDGHQPAYGGLAQAEEQFFRDIFKQAAGGNEACFEPDGHRDHGHERFKTDGIGAAAIVDDGQRHAELLCEIVEEIDGQAEYHGGRAADTGYGTGGSRHAGAMFDVGIET